MRRFVLAVLLCSTCLAGCPASRTTRPNTPEAQQAQLPDLGACHGEKRALTISSQMPYYLARVGTAEGHFVLDFGSNGSYIDTKGFQDGAVPQPVSAPSNPNSYDGFDFYGSWGTVTLRPQSYGHIQGKVRQAGKIGTDFLSLHVFTLDYANGSVYRANQGTFCTDAVLTEEGFKPATTAGFYSNSPGMGPNDPPNIPAVPVRVGNVTAVGQIDTGFDDGAVRHSVNINRPFFDALQAAGVRLAPTGRNEPSLTTCVKDVFDKITSYRLEGGTSFEILAMDGSTIASAPDTVLFLKETPAEAKSCLGIGGLAFPAAQIGASFYVDARRIVVDPFASRVWFGPVGSSGRSSAAGQN